MARGMKVETLTISRQINKAPDYSFVPTPKTARCFPSSLTRFSKFDHAFGNKGETMKSLKLFFLISVGLIVSAPLAFAQQGNDGHGHGSGDKMMADMPDDIKKMMQEPNKALAQASIQYMTVFTKSLHTQSSERRDRIDGPYIKAVFAEMKRAYNMIESFQNAHVKTMDAAMREKVNMMMTKMNNNLAGIKNHLDILEKEVNGKQSLDIIADRTREILKYLDDMPKPRQGGMDMPGNKQKMMQ
jgi:ribosomal protein S15P/S13E